MSESRILRLPRDTLQAVRSVSNGSAPAASAGGSVARVFALAHSLTEGRLYEKLPDSLMLPLWRCDTVFTWPSPSRCNACRRLRGFKEMPDAKTHGHPAWDSRSPAAHLRHRRQVHRR